MPEPRAELAAHLKLADQTLARIREAELALPGDVNLEARLCALYQAIRPLTASMKRLGILAR